MRVASLRRARVRPSWSSASPQPSTAPNATPNRNTSSTVMAQVSVPLVSPQRAQESPKSSDPGHLEPRRRGLIPPPARGSLVWQTVSAVTPRGCLPTTASARTFGRGWVEDDPCMRLRHDVSRQHDGVAQPTADRGVVADPVFGPGQFPGLAEEARLHAHFISSPSSCASSTTTPQPSSPTWLERQRPASGLVVHARLRSAVPRWRSPPSASGLPRGSR